MLREERERTAELGTLRNALRAEHRRPREQRKPEEIEKLQGRIAEAEVELRALHDRIDTQYPRYAELKRPKELDVSEVQNILEDGEVVLSYTVLDDRSAAFVLDGESFAVVDIPMGRREIAERVGQFREGVTGIRTMEDLERFDWTNAYKLYRDLFEPAAAAVGEPRVLYICADDFLYTLPFEGLVTRRPDRGRFKELRRKASRGELPRGSEYGALEYFVDRYTTAYLPSVTVLRSLRSHAKPEYGRWKKPLVAFADPVFGPDDPIFREASVDSAQEISLVQRDLLLRCTGATGIPRLPQSGREAESVRKVVGGNAGDLYLRSRATEQNVFESGLAKARYVLFSTHGLLGGDFEGVLEPGLVMCLVGNPRGRDGFLMMSEVLELDLNAELVVLSACNTSGEGERAGNGEGFAGLTQAFAYADGRSLLVSHWSVESGTTRELIVKVFEGLDARGRAGALRETKRSLKRKVREEADGSGSLSLAHPFFWAPFVLVGER
jgi:CHAT domain-containing protein